MNQDNKIGPDPCWSCGGEYGEHRDDCETLRPKPQPALLATPLRAEPTKPLPCPFCGNDYISIRYTDSKQIMRAAYCRDVDCGARGPDRSDDTWAITAWNNRADSETKFDSESALAFDRSTFSSPVTDAKGELFALCKDKETADLIAGMSEDAKRTELLYETLWKATTSEFKSLFKDKARLDWLEDHHEEFAEELCRLGWTAPNDAQWEKLKLLLRRIRFAVDSAIDKAALAAGGEK